MELSRESQARDSVVRIDGTVSKSYIRQTNSRYLEFVINGDSGNYVVVFGSGGISVLNANGAIVKSIAW